MKKYKAIAVPVTFIGDKPRFLTVRDRRFKDWIFVTGGCRRREIPNPIRCALRELEEETRGVVSLKKGEYTEFKFVVTEQAELIRKFNDEKQKMNLRKIQKQPIKRTHDENDFMNFETLSEFSTKKQWDRIVKNVLNNPEFYACVTSLDRKTFSIK